MFIFNYFNLKKIYGLSGKQMYGLPDDKWLLKPIDYCKNRNMQASMIPTSSLNLPRSFDFFKYNFEAKQAYGSLDDAYHYRSL